MLDNHIVRLVLFCNVSIRHREIRTIYRGLQRLFDATLDNPGLTATLVPLGDGILMLRKNVADVQLPVSE